MKTSKNFKTILFAACFAFLIPITSQAQEAENFLLTNVFNIKLNCNGKETTD